MSSASRSTCWRLQAALAGLAYSGDTEPVADSHGAAAVFDLATYRELFVGEEAEGGNGSRRIWTPLPTWYPGVERNIASGRSGRVGGKRT